jgi:hypothetical protein
VTGVDERHYPTDERTAFLDAVAGLVDDRFGGCRRRPCVTAVHLTRALLP